MRIVVWNCAMALHQKLDALLGLEPDIAIVPECASPDVATLAREYSALKVPPTAWTGKWKHKGLGVFAFGDYRLGHVQEGSPAANYALHVPIKGPTTFDLLALWTQAPGYVENAHAAIKEFEEVLRRGRCVVGGDLNSSAKFDHRHKPNHSDLVQVMGERFGMLSAYHQEFGTTHGEEADPTHLHRMTGKEFHLDYVFVPKSWTLAGVEVGTRSGWGSLSDHYPLIVDVEAG